MTRVNEENSAPITASPRARKSSERRPLAPVTPQRMNRLPKQMRTPSTPLTPSYSSVASSPFTPITNVYSSASSVASPNSSASTKVDFSPDILKPKSKSIADTANNWRTRAKENGIKVASENAKELLNSPRDALPASFLTTHRRSRQALFQTKSSDSTAFISPKTSRMLVNDDTSVTSASTLSSSMLSTPEPTRSLSGAFSLSTPSPRTSLAIVQKMRERGSLTDPARTRRREPFGSFSGETLFDIDEDAPTCSPFPQTFGSPLVIRSSGARCVSAPFMPGKFVDDVDDDDETLEDDGLPTAPKTSKLRAARSASAISSSTISSEVDSQKNVDVTITRACSVCSASSSPMSTLKPCGHLICSSCLTGALNIVGEKDMRCATCEQPVDDFKLLAPMKLDSPIKVKESKQIPAPPLSLNKASEETLTLLPSAFDELTIKETRPPADELSQNRSSAALPTIVAEIAVLRIDNVPWDVTPSSLEEFFSPYSLIHAHVLLDPKGKTMSHAYVEINAGDARNALRAVQNKTMGKGRRLRGVTVTMSSQSELMRSLFPNWLGSFENSKPTLAGLDHSGVVRALENGLLNINEIDGLVLLMRNPKSHFLKVPSLPFYSFVSILSKFPTDMDSRVFWNGNMRDVLFDVSIMAIQILVNRIGGDLHDQDLLEAVVQTVIGSKVFSGDQLQKLYSLVETSVATRGGELSCLPPRSEINAYESSSSGSSSNSEVLTPKEYNMPITMNVNQGPRQQQRLGLGKPVSLRTNDHVSPYSHASVSPFPPQVNLAPMASPHMTSSVLGYGGINVTPNMHYTMASPPQNSFDILAREFGVQPDLVAALAQRLSMSGPVTAHGIAGLLYPNGRY